MKIIGANVELIKTDNPLKLVELAGKTCYKSECNITEDSHITFVQKMIDSGHHAMLEHANFTYEGYIPNNIFTSSFEEKYKHVRKYMQETDEAFTINLRTLTELGLEPYNLLERMYNVDEINNLYIDERRIHKHITLRFTCDRGVSHELVRHRTASFAQESTRFCNYNKDKFGNELTFIEPCFWNSKSNIKDLYKMFEWRSILSKCESSYLRSIENGSTPQEARSVLPNSLKTEVVMTTNIEGWQHFLDLRYLGLSGKPHPSMVEVATIAKDLLKQEDAELFEKY